MALQFVERRNAIFFTTQQLSKLLLISKRSPKELDTIEMNNILKFQHNSWTINRDHIKFKFSFKLGWGFLWLMLRVGPLPPQKHMAKKAPTNNCKKYIGQNKSGRSGLCLATKPYIAILLLVLSSCGNDQALLELVLLDLVRFPRICGHFRLVSNIKSEKKLLNRLLRIICICFTRAKCKKSETWHHPRVVSRQRMQMLVEGR